MTIPPQELQFVARFIERFPRLQAVLSESVRSYGEVLPHLFLADVTRLLVDDVNIDLARGESDSAKWAEIARFLEDEYRGGCSVVRELIAVSFVENLPGRDSLGKVLLRILPKVFLEELE